MIIERAATIINVIEYLTISSICTDGSPWNTPVYSAYDEELNFYWASWVKNQHSRNIETHPDVFCVIYDSRAPAGTGEGIYFKGLAHSLHEEEEIRKGRRLLDRREGTESDEDKIQKLIDGNPRRIFQFTPTVCWMNDGSTKNGDYIDIRKEIDLSQLKKYIADQDD